MKLDIGNVPVEKVTETEGDGVEVGNVYLTRHHNYFTVIYRLTNSSAFGLRFRISDGSFYGHSQPMRSVYRREYLVGKVNNMPEAFTLNVDWDQAAFKGRKLRI